MNSNEDGRILPALHLGQQRAAHHRRKTTIAKGSHAMDLVIGIVSPSIAN